MRQRFAVLFIWALASTLRAQTVPAMFGTPDRPFPFTGRSTAMEPSLRKGERPLTTASSPPPVCKTYTFEGLPDKVRIPSFDGISAVGWVSGISVAAGGQAQFINAPSGVTSAVFLYGGSNDITFSNPAQTVQYDFASGYVTTLTAYDSGGAVVASETIQPNWDGNPAGYEVWDPIPPLTSSGNPIARINLQSPSVLNNFLAIDNFQVCVAPKIAGVEMTQAIQQYQTLADLKTSLANTNEPLVPIISGKPGVMRVYMNPVPDVTSFLLHLTIPGVIDLVKAVTLPSYCAADQERNHEVFCPSTDFYFTPPSGPWTATIDVTDPRSGQLYEEEVLPFKSRDTQSLRMRAVGICSWPTATDWYCGQSSDLLSRITLLAKVAPTNNVYVDDTHNFVRVDLHQIVGPFQQNDNADNHWWHNMNSQLDRMYSFSDAGLDKLSNRHTTYFGMIPQGVAPKCCVGQAHHVPSHAAAAWNNVPLWGTDIRDFAVAHETGHTLGLKHTYSGFPGQDGMFGCFGFANDDTTDWPWKYVDDNNPGSNFVQSNGGYETGFDVAARKILPGKDYLELMSYCYPNWVAPQRYKTMIKTLGGGGVTTPSAEPAPQTPEPRTTSAQPFWLVSGSIPPAGPPRFDPIFQQILPGDTGDGAGSYTLEAQDNSGAALFVQHVTPGSPTDLPANTPDLPPNFSAVIPVTAHTARIVLKDPTSAVLGSVAMGGAAPTVAVTNPTAAFTGLGDITWTIDDPDSSSFDSKVSYSPDNGATWAEIGEVPNSGTSLTANFNSLPGSNGQGLIKVLVSDGANTGQALSPNFSIPKKNPSLVQITAPAPNTAQPALDRVLLQGLGYDTDDGVLAGNALQWSSNLQGALGSGGNLSVLLQPGIHTITLTATDSDGNSISTSNTLTIADQPPSFNIGFGVLSQPPASSSTCLVATVSTAPGTNGAPVTAINYSIDGGVTYTALPLSPSPYGFVVPGTGLISLVFQVTDASGQSDAGSLNYFNLYPCANVNVPDVVGRTQANASSTITAAKFVVGTVTRGASNTVPAGSVMGQSPAAGTALGPGASTNVNLVVSNGAQTAVPDVVGMTQAAATTVLTAAGLAVGTVTTSPSSVVPAGQIIGEAPAAGALVNAGASVNLVISSGAALTIVSPAGLPAATVGSEYDSIAMTAQGGAPVYSWSATGLPPDMAIDPASGVISGTPSSNVGTPFHVQVTVTDGNTLTANKPYDLTVYPALTITGPNSLKIATVGAAYTPTTVTAGGGAGGFKWSASGLPNGMSIASSTGVISGTPTTNLQSPYSVQIAVTDANRVITTGTYTLVVHSQLAVSGPDLPSAPLNAAYPSTTLTASGGAGGYSWSASGLPTGLTLDQTSGVLSGVVTSAAGSPFAVVVTVTDSLGVTATRNYTLNMLGAATCDITGDTHFTVADVQKIVGEVLAPATATHDLNGDHIVNVVDVQIVINAVISGVCVL